ncbi:MAG: DnaJ domain-containing protein, partial [Patescibacteria group bacterium]
MLGTAKPYEILGVSPSADATTVRKAYRALIVKFHPDKHPGPDIGFYTEKTKEINAAYSAFLTLNNLSRCPGAAPETGSCYTPPSPPPPKQTSTPPPPPAAPKPRPIDLFPHGKVRPGQDAFIKDIRQAIMDNRVLFAHAPTGLGKTAAAIAPCLEYALDNGKIVLFLTPKQSQHQIVVDTLKKIQTVLKRDLRTVDVIGKASMCPMNQGSRCGRGSYKDFTTMCRDLQKHKRCKFAMKMDKVSDLDLMNLFPGTEHVEEFCQECAANELCPSKTALRLMGMAEVIVCDYSYLFSDIFQRTLMLAGLSLSDLVVIVDEAHNLPDRIRDMNSGEMTLEDFEYAIEELNENAQEFKEQGSDDQARDLMDASLLLGTVVQNIEEWIRGIKGEVAVSRFDLVPMVERIISYRYPRSYEDFLASLSIAVSMYAGDGSSAVGDVVNFLRGFNLDDQKCYKAIVLTPDGPALRFRLIDPGVVSGPILHSLDAAILMSGTLTPTRNYQRQLGVAGSRSYLKEYPSPFPKNQKLVLVDRRMDTKFTSRTPEGYTQLRTAIQE